MTSAFKNFFTCVWACSFFALAPIPAQADETPVPAEKLPAPAQAFLKEHFATQKIVLVMHDKGWVKDTYEATLADGTEIEFSGSGEWLEIEMRGKKSLPDSVLLPAIRTHLEADAKNATVKEIARKRYGFKLELHDGRELRFDKKGKFIGYD